MECKLVYRLRQKVALSGSVYVYYQLRKLAGQGKIFEPEGADSSSLPPRAANYSKLAFMRRKKYSLFSSLG
jgi:hypothetical protein